MPDDDPATIALGQQILQSQPFSVYLGAKISEFAVGSVELVIPVRAELRQQHGFVHGGVIAYAADNALTFAAGSMLGPAIVTSGFAISYLRPANGIAVAARSWVIKGGRRQAVCQVDIFTEDESGARQLCATAQGSAMTLEENDEVREGGGVSG